MMEDSGPPPSKRAKTRWMTIMGEEGSRIVAEAIAEDILVKDNLISFTCKACNTSMSGVIPAETHLKGARHKKAVQNSRLGAASEPISSCDRPDSTTSSLCAVIKSGLVLCQSVGNQLQLTCVPCNKPCTGEVPMNQHLASDAHAKKMRQDILRPRCLPNKEAPTTPSSIPTTVQYDLASTEDVSSVQDVPTAIQCGLVLVMHMEGSTVVHFKCVPCNKQCTGEVPMKQHLTSEIHAKKLRQDALNPRCSPYKEAPITTTTTTPATTVQYDLVTPADVSPLQDLPTAIHRKLVSVMHVEGSNVVHFKCVPCNKQCTGEVPMKQHLTSEIHAKKLREEAMMQRFSPHKEVLSTTTTATTTQTNLALPADIPSVQVDEVAQAMEEDIIRQADYDASHLECLLCETFCTGRDAMKQHLQGKNHLKKQRTFQLGFSQSLPRSAHSETLEYSLPPPKSDKIPKEKTTIAEMSSELQEVSGEGCFIRKQENSYECTVCKIICNSHTQVSTHFKGDQHKKQCRLNKSVQLQQFVCMAAAGTETAPAPGMTSIPAKNADCISFIPPPRQFEDPIPVIESAAAQEMEYVEFRSIFKDSTSTKAQDQITHQYVFQPSKDCKRKCPSEKLLKLLPDIKVYMPKDSLSDLFDE